MHSYANTNVSQVLAPAPIYASKVNQSKAPADIETSLFTGAAYPHLPAHLQHGVQFPLLQSPSSLVQRKWGSRIKETTTQVISLKRGCGSSAGRTPTMKKHKRLPPHQTPQISVPFATDTVAVATCTSSTNGDCRIESITGSELVSSKSSAKPVHSESACKQPKGDANKERPSKSAEGNCIPPTPDAKAAPAAARAPTQVSVTSPSQLLGAECVPKNTPQPCSARPPPDQMRGPGPQLIPNPAMFAHQAPGSPLSLFQLVAQHKPSMRAADEIFRNYGYLNFCLAYDPCLARSTIESCVKVHGTVDDVLGLQGMEARNTRDGQAVRATNSMP